VIASTARSNASAVAGEGFWTPLILRTYWRAAASISSGVACGSRPRSVVMFRHMRARVRRTPATVDPMPPSTLSLRARLLRLACSWVLIAIGVPLVVSAQLGVAPFDVFNTGIADVTGLSFGTVFVIDGLVFFGLGALLGARPGPASWVGAVAIGPMIDVALSLIPEPDLIAARVPMLVGGILVLAVGICLAISTDLGAGPTEVVMLGLIAHRIGVVMSRWLSDGVPMLVGVALGGDLGVGTLVFLIAMGPLVKIGLRLLRYVPHGLDDPATAVGAAPGRSRRRSSAPINP